MGLRSSAWYQDLVTNELVNMLPWPIRGVFIAFFVVGYYMLVLLLYASGLWLVVALWGQGHPQSWNKVFGSHWEQADYGPDGKLHRIEPGTGRRWTWSTYLFVILMVITLLMGIWSSPRMHGHPY